MPGRLVCHGFPAPSAGSSSSARRGAGFGPPRHPAEDASPSPGTELGDSLVGLVGREGLEPGSDFASRPLAKGMWSMRTRSETGEEREGDPGQGASTGPAPAGPSGDDDRLGRERHDRLLTREKLPAKSNTSSPFMLL
jgi:hypothetical protein